MKPSVLGVSCLVVSFLVFGCGGSQSSPDTPQAGADLPQEERGASDSALAEADTEGDPEAEESEEADAKPEPREIRYMMSPEGLSVEIDGLKLVATAEPVKKGNGWGVRVTLDGKVTDDAGHNFLWPEDGPMAFAGTVTRGGAKSRFGDERETQAEKTFSSGEAFQASREWPGSIDVEPLKAGHSLDLEIGLWGFGSDARSRRPLRDFLLVRMTAGKSTPQPLVQPPASAGQ